MVGLWFIKKAEKGVKASYSFLENGYMKYGEILPDVPVVYLASTAGGRRVRQLLSHLVLGGCLTRWVRLFEGNEAFVQNRGEAALRLFKFEAL
ncbi:MAG: hypothetical protein QXN15_10160 [Candidatus Jordarchaeales archaeon]|nr:hypothetical protein [Candidatus Jordarchaeia archaeon]